MPGGRKSREPGENHSSHGKAALDNLRIEFYNAFPLPFFLDISKTHFQGGVKGISLSPRTSLIHVINNSNFW
jgi:hypothetical protein